MFHVAIKFFDMNLKYYFVGGEKDIGLERLESYGSGEGPVVESGEHSGPLQDYTKYGEFTECQNDYELFHDMVVYRSYQYYARSCRC
jgi:hypothetical protein